MLSTRIFSVFHILFSLHLAHAQVPEVSPNGHVSIWYPIPQSNGTLLSFNAIDTLVMSYDTQWQAANASMWCLTTETENLYTGQALGSSRLLSRPYFAFMVRLTESSVEPTGNYIIHDLNSQIGGTEFPLPCHFAFVDPNNETDTYAGGSFIMVSTAGVASTWSLKEQVATQTSGTLTSTSSLVIMTSASTSKLTTSQTTQSSASSTSLYADPAESIPASTFNSLSAGAKAGIALGVFFAVAAIAGLAFWIIRRRRQSHKKKSYTPSKAESFIGSSAPEMVTDLQGPRWGQASELGSDVAREQVAELGTKPYGNMGPHEMATTEVPTAVMNTQVRELTNSDEGASEQSGGRPGRQRCQR